MNQQPQQPQQTQQTKSTQELRSYHFGNFYMSSIQQGIQAGHAISEYFNKYEPYTDTTADMLFEWNKNHKTMILLNGGMNINLEETATMLDHVDNIYPWSTFYEAQEAMAGMLTNVAIVLPERIFNGAAMIRSRQVQAISVGNFGYVLEATEQSNSPELFELLKTYGEYSEFEYNLMLHLNKHGLAK